MTIEKRLKIGEVSRLLNIPTYVLRYWEDEFRDLKPRKTRSGQRLYSQKDLDFIRLIAHLRYEEKLTISGCRDRLKTRRVHGTVPARNGGPDDSVRAALTKIKKGLQEILEELR